MDTPHKRIDYRQMAALVTGADGFIGSHLVEALVREGARVTAVAQYNSFGTNGWLDSLAADVLANVEIHRADIRDRTHMVELSRGKQVIFHLAALISVPYSFHSAQSFVETNVLGTLNMLEAARANGVARIVCTSTSEVYGTAQTVPIGETHRLHAQSPYAASKIGADMLAQSFALTHGLQVVLLRPFNTFGPRQSERAVIASVIRQAIDPNCSEIRVGSLVPRRDFNYVGDIADAFLAAGKADIATGDAYNVGTGDAISIGELCTRVLSFTGTNKSVVQEDTRLRPDTAEVFELVADAARFRNASGWAPKTDFDQGLQNTIAWWRERLTAGGFRRSRDYVV